MKVKLLRELLVNEGDTQATAKNTTVDMDEARAKDLAARGLVEFPGSKKLVEEPVPMQDNTVVTAPVPAPRKGTTGTVRRSKPK